MIHTSGVVMRSKRDNIKSTQHTYQTASAQQALGNSTGGGSGMALYMNLQSNQNSQITISQVSLIINEYL